jgi:hypothetical protein
VQKVRWEGRTHIFLRKCEWVHELNTGIFLHKRLISTVKSVEFVSDRMSYIILRGLWCHINVLKVHAPTEDKIDGVKESFY